jgi:hypothetical protein
VLVALVLQVIGAVVVVALLVLLFGFTAYHFLRVAWLVALVAGVVGTISVVFLGCAYEYSYLRIRRGQYQEAQAPTLVIGILSVFLGLIPGILYLVGYVKLGDAVREQQVVTFNHGPGYGFALAPGAPVPMIACRQCQRVYYVGQFPFCPNCGQKLSP